MREKRRVVISVASVVQRVRAQRCYRLVLAMFVPYI
jgi:hypothetical protein